MKVLFNTTHSGAFVCILYIFILLVRSLTEKDKGESGSQGRVIPGKQQLSSAGSSVDEAASVLLQVFSSYYEKLSQEGRCLGRGKSLFYGCTVI